MYGSAQSNPGDVLDRNSLSEMNLKVLKRIDPHTEEVLISPRLRPCQDFLKHCMPITEVCSSQITEVPAAPEGTQGCSRSRTVMPHHANCITVDHTIPTVEGSACPMCITHITHDHPQK